MSSALSKLESGVYTFLSRDKPDLPSTEDAWRVDMAMPCSAGVSQREFLCECMYTYACVCVCTHICVCAHHRTRVCTHVYYRCMSLRCTTRHTLDTTRELNAMQGKHRKNLSQLICCTRLPLTACKALDNVFHHRIPTCALICCTNVIYVV